jgi:hypothetical protein
MTFDNEILTQSNLVYEEDYNLGDLVTAINNKWRVVLDSRITEVTEIYEVGGYRINAVFGNNIPTLVERIKQEMDYPLIEKGLLEQGEPGVPGKDGKDGVGLHFVWDGTKLGVKREDETEYTYVDLKGPQGIQGPKGDRGDIGPQGPAGKSVEFVWDGTRLGIRLEGETAYQYVDLKGDKGDPGPPGKDGSDAEVTHANVIDAIGYTPVNKAGDTMTGTLIVDGKNLPSGADIVTMRRGSGTNRFVLETQNKSMRTFLEAGASIGLMGTITASDFRIRTNYLDRMSVSGSSGNVGIGTTSPSQKLDVDGKIRMRIQTQASDADDIVATKKYVDDKAAASGIQIGVGATEPPGLMEGDWWYKEI